MENTKAAPITNPILKFESKPTRAYAIKAMCAQCMGCTRENTEEGYRTLIKECKSSECPLFTFRPYQGK